MQNTHGTTRLIGRAALVALLAAPTLGAQGRWEDSDRVRREQERQLYTWRGVVDDETRIYMRAGRIESQVVNGSVRRSSGRVSRANPLPRREGMVRVQLIEGRGRVHVIQQPTADNDYTAIVRIKDSQGGAGSYRLATFFDPTTSVSRRGRIWDDVGGEVSGTSVFRWSGNVDGDLRIALRRGQIGYEVASGQQPRDVRSRVLSTQIPRDDVQLMVSLRQGRGAVQVLQQPSQFNNYTAIIRVVDPQGGYGYYDFDLMWR
jgi:hypothetical protein